MPYNQESFNSFKFFAFILQLFHSVQTLMILLCTREISQHELQKTYLKEEDFSSLNFQKMASTIVPLKMGHHGRVIHVDESITPTTLTPTTLFDDDQPELMDQSNETKNHVFSDSSLSTPIFPVKVSCGITGTTHNHDETPSPIGNDFINSSYCPYNDILQLYDRKTHQLQFYFVKDGQPTDDNTTFQFLNNHITIDNCCFKS